MATVSQGETPSLTWPSVEALAVVDYPALEERLFANAAEFDFFQAVRLLELWGPQRQPLGEAGPPPAEVVRLRVNNTSSFPPSSVWRLERPSKDLALPVMTVNFMGLTGPSGTLPRHYTNVLERTIREWDNPERYVLRDWLDMFNHRLISLFYRAWVKYRFWVVYERRQHIPTAPDLFTHVLQSLVGIGTTGLSNRLRVSSKEPQDGVPQERVLSKVEDEVLLYFGGFLSQRLRSADSLKNYLEDYFSLPVEILQFQGQWLQLETMNRSRLIEDGGNNELGTTAVVGARVWDVESKIRIRVGPLDYAQFQGFLPDRSARKECKSLFMLIHLVRFYVGPELDVDIQLVLQRYEVPDCRLPRSTADGPQLGWNSWLRSQSPVHDVADALFPGEEMVWVNEDTLPGL